MKVQRVYIDTSVIGGCFDEEFAPWSSGLMKDFRLGNFDPVVSEVVTAEIEENAPEEVQAQHRWLLELKPAHLEIDDDVVQLANTYVERGVLTWNYFDDALHVALASVNAVELLVSWNFRHIVHLPAVSRLRLVSTRYADLTRSIRSRDTEPSRFDRRER